VQPPVDPQATPPGDASSAPTAKRSRAAFDPASEAAKRALTREQAAEVITKLRALCVNWDADPGLLEQTADVLRNAGYKQELAVVLRDSLASPDAHPHVGALWMRRLAASNTWDRQYPAGMDALCRRGEIGHLAVLEFLEVAAAKHKANLVTRAVRKHGRWLRTHPRGWGVAARALVNVRCYKAAAAWMSDWRSRPELEPALSYCLAFALRGAGRFQEAHQFIKGTLEKSNAGEQFPGLQVWYAMEEALAGNTETAAAHFKQLKPLAWDDDLLCRYYLTRGVIRVQQAEPNARKEAFDLACERIKDRFRRGRVYQKDLLLRREYRRCLSRMGRDSGRLTTGVRAAWRSADSSAFVAPLLLVPGLQFFLPLYLYRLCRRRKGTFERGR
jgi:hypothetical protein